MWYYSLAATTSMSAKRAAGYCGGALLLLAWLSSAGSLMGPSAADVQEQPRAVETAGTTDLAADIQAQTDRLRNRLASAPAPQRPSRNPFEFATREVPVPRLRQAPVEPVPPLSLAPPEPAIELIGVAENQSPKGVVRTAIISAL